MAKTVRTKSRNKCNILDISSDGLTKFCSKIGTSGIQVEQIAINEEPVRSSRPIHGIFSLFKHRLLPAHVISSPSRHSDIYFSQQTNHKTYALHALLHVLFNSTDDMEMNEDLVQFKQSTQKLTPKLKGMAIHQYPLFKQAYRNLPKKSCTSSKEMYRSISYIRFKGYLWELDGLKECPQRLWPCEKDDWLSMAKDELRKKIDMYDGHDVSVWAVTQDEKLKYHRKIIGLNYIKFQTEIALDIHDSSWRKRGDIDRWEEEYHFVINHNKQYRLGRIESDKLYHHYCQSFYQLPIEEQTVFKSKLEEYMKMQDKMYVWLDCQNQILRLYESIGLEYEKTKDQFDYTPFIWAYIHGLYEEGHLQWIVNPVQINTVHIKSKK